MAGTMVEFASNGSKTAGYLATPASGKGPGVLVLQEWWGLVGHIKNVCDRFAAEGFTALAPDMYHGKTASEPDGAGKLFMALNISQAERDLRGAATYLLGQSSAKKIGAVGFCMGGQLALYAATLNPSVGACVNFYGIHPNVKPSRLLQRRPTGRLQPGWRDRRLAAHACPLPPESEIGAWREHDNEGRLLGGSRVAVFGPTPLAL